MDYDCYEFEFSRGAQCKIESICVDDKVNYIHIALLSIEKEWHKTFPETDLDILTKQFNWNAKIFLDYARYTGNEDNKFQIFLDDSSNEKRKIEFRRGGNRVKYSFFIDIPKGKNDLDLFNLLVSKTKLQKENVDLKQEMVKLKNEMNLLETKNKILQKEKRNLIIKENQYKKQVDFLKQELATQTYNHQITSTKTD